MTTLPPAPSARIEAIAVAEMAEALKDTLSLYDIPEDDLIGDVLMPAMHHAEGVWIGTGFFSSKSFLQIAPGLADFPQQKRSTPAAAFEPGYFHEGP